MRPDRQAEANALLIAAEPELLEELKKWEQWFTQGSEKPDDIEHPNPDVTRAIIQKAEGNIDS